MPLFSQLISDCFLLLCCSFSSCCKMFTETSVTFHESDQTVLFEIKKWLAVIVLNIWNRCGQGRFKHHYSFNQCTFTYPSPKICMYEINLWLFLQHQQHSKIFTYCRSWKISISLRWISAKPSLVVRVSVTEWFWQGNSVSTFVSVSPPLDIYKETLDQFQISKHIFVMRNRDISSHVWGNFLHKTQNDITTK